MQLYNHLIKNCKKYKKKIAIEGDTPISFQDLEKNVHNSIHYFQQLGISANDRIAVLSENRVEILYLSFAASFIGFSLVFLYDLSHATQHEFEKIMQDSECNFVMLSECFSEKFSGLQEVVLLNKIHEWVTMNCVPTQSREEPQKTLFQTYTSGTTGKPKGVCLSEKSIYFQAMNISHAMKIDKKSRVLLTGFLFNTTGLPLSFATLLCGGTLVFRESSHLNDFLFEVSSKKITHFMMQPSYLEKIFHDEKCDEYNLSSLKLIAYGAAPISQRSLRKMRQKINCQWLQGYGLTETCGPVTWLTEKEHQYDKTKSSVGKAAKGVTIQLINDEIVISGPSIMLGYWNAKEKKPEPVSSVFTGDLGVLKGKYLYLKGRKKDCIILSNGYTLYPREIEIFLETFADIYQSKLIGIKKSSNETPVLALYGKNIDLFYLKNHIKKNFSSLKWPAYFYISSVPFFLNSNGKVDTEKIKNMIAEAFQSGCLVSF